MPVPNLHGTDFLSLGEAAEIYQGISSPSVDAGQSMDAQILTIHQLQSLVFSDEGSKKSVPLNMKRLQLEFDDIIVSLRNQPMQTTVWRSPYGPAIPGTTLAVIRIKPSYRDRIQPLYVASLLKSRRASIMLSPYYKKTTSGMYIKLNDLKSFTIPIPRIDTQSKLSDLAELTEILKTKSLALIESRENYLHSSFETLFGDEA